MIKKFYFRIFKFITTNYLKFYYYRFFNKDFIESKNLRYKIL